MSLFKDTFTTEPLVCLMYVSAEAKPFRDSDLFDILLSERPRYRTAGITGILLYNEQTFIGVMEGGRDVVRQVFEGICRDCRYISTTSLLEEEIHFRQFHDWTLGFKPNDWLLAEITPGFNPLMRNPKWSHEDMGVCSGKMFQFLRNFRA